MALLNNAIEEDQFPHETTGTSIIGCNFHWKQAIRRKLLSFKIPRDIISELMGAHGLINILPLVPATDIELKGI
jgi:hypothetical protein